MRKKLFIFSLIVLAGAVIALIVTESNKRTDKVMSINYCFDEYHDYHVC